MWTTIKEYLTRATLDNKPPFLLGQLSTIAFLTAKVHVSGLLLSCATRRPFRRRGARTPNPDPRSPNPNPRWGLCIPPPLSVPLFSLRLDECLSRPPSGCHSEGDKTCLAPHTVLRYLFVAICWVRYTASHQYTLRFASCFPAGDCSLMFHIL